MPYIYFESEVDRPLANRYRVLVFCAACASGGMWLHPHHTNFLGGAHTVDDIDATLVVTESAFQQVAKFVRDTTATPKL
jgi:glutamate-1-semialdehyde 2,1-aminomutase